MIQHRLRRTGRQPAAHRPRGRRPTGTAALPGPEPICLPTRPGHSPVKHWTVDIDITEDPDQRHTDARAALAAGTPMSLSGDGTALRSAGDDITPQPT
ncbi:dsRBD fold-containing protein [Catellatospora sp. IY07-71]|uniref:dsRBD fold-containing protein n=1 Tax=Catellatospora sp. IY07-71 TaxID=2728827 RepID=UPI001BB38E73